MYVLAIAYFVFIGGARFWAAGHHAHGHTSVVPEPYASGIFFGALLVLTLVLVSAAGGKVGAFTSLADARFLIGSRLRERNVIVWLQLRTSWRLIARLLFLIIFYTILYSAAGSFLGMALSMAGFVAFCASFSIPTMRLQRRFGTRAGFVLPTVTGTCAIAGLTALAAGFLFPQQAHFSTAVEHLGLGRLILAMLAGSWLPIALLYALTVLMGATAYWGAEDLYPELYHGSSRMIDLVRRRRRNPFAFERGAPAMPPTATSARIVGRGGMHGAWSILWKDWVVFKRSRGSRYFFFAGIALAIGAGAALGVAVRRMHDPMGASIGLAASIGNLLVVFVAMYSSASLAADIGKPLWWLNVDALRARLYVQIVATSWRLALCIALWLLTWAIVIPSAHFALAAIPVSAAVVVFLRAIGLALYSLFPSAIDQRGPIAMLRIFALYVLVLPPLAAGIFAGYFSHAVAAGVGTGMFVAVIQALLLIEFAAARIARSGNAFARAEMT